MLTISPVKYSGTIFRKSVGNKTVADMLEEIKNIATSSYNLSKIYDAIKKDLPELAQNPTNESLVKKAIQDIIDFHSMSNNPANKIKSSSKAIIGYCQETLMQINN
jgi:hypothetical protein